MSEGKLSSNSSGAKEDESAGEKQAGGKAFGLGGRFRAPSSAQVDLPTYAPEDDDVVNEVAKRFRSGPSIGSPVLALEESLDQKVVEGENVDEGSLLIALEAKHAPVEAVPVLEEQTHTVRELPADTDRLDTDMIDALPTVNVEPLTGQLEAAKVDSAIRAVVCPSCRAENPEGMSFCVECGGALQHPNSSGSAAVKGATAEPIVEMTRKPPPASAAAKEENPWAIQMVSINEDGSDGKSIPLEYLETTVGREADARFPTDAFLSPKHARFHIEKGKAYIEDLYSLNGTFIKLRDETRLTPGDTILMGRQVLRFERFEQSITPKTKSTDGTRYMGSPAPGGSYKILQTGIGGVIQNVYCLPEAGAVLGREKGDIVFPHDKFMSGRHSQIYTGDDGHCYLVDLNSSNGTWIKIWEKTPLENKDYIFMGQQLFRVQYDS